MMRFCLFSFLSLFVVVSFAAKNDPPSRIIGGNDATSGEYPSIAQFDYNGNHFCAGSLIDYSWILTAAHCLDGLDKSKIKVTLGEHDTSVTETGEQGDLGITKIILHEGYPDTPTLGDPGDNDIALIRLDGPVSITSSVSFATISDVPDTPATLTTAGWGFTIGGDDESVATVLQEVDGPRLSQATCEDFYDHEFPPSTRQFCTGSSSNANGACNGDSGGPVYFGDDLVGIVSFGAVDCPISGYQVHTRVGAYESWIDEQLDTVKIRVLYIGYNDNPSPTSSSVQSYVDEIANGTKTYEQIAEDFFDASPLSGKSRGEVVEDLYDHLFNRAPAAAGKDYWVNSGIPKHLLAQALVNGAQNSSAGNDVDNVYGLIPCLGRCD